MPISHKMDWPLMNPLLASQFNALQSNPLSTISILENVQLKTGTNVLNTLLGRMQQGWIILDQQGPASIYRSAAFNSLTLTLTSSADVVVSLGVF